VLPEAAQLELAFKNKQPILCWRHREESLQYIDGKPLDFLSHVNQKLPLKVILVLFIHLHDRLQEQFSFAPGFLYRDCYVLNVENS
jgi:hypothetical protein